MGLQGNGTIPAVYSERIKLAKHAGMAVMELFKKNICPRDIMTKEAFENALTVDMALGWSTNTMLHLPAIAFMECSIFSFTVFPVAVIKSRCNKFFLLNSFITA